MSTKRNKDERETMFERVDGLMAVRRTERCSEATEMAGFLSIFHPEIPDDKRAKLAIELTRKENRKP